MHLYSLTSSLGFRSEFKIKTLSDGIFEVNFVNMLIQIVCDAVDTAPYNII